MKRVLSIALILLAITQIAGLTPFYFYCLQNIKAEAGVELAKASDLQQLVVTEQQYNDPAQFQPEGEKEFRFHGQLYDFKQMTRNGGDYVFAVVADKQETVLSDFLSNVFAQDTGNNKAAKAPFSNLFKSLVNDFVYTGCFEYTAFLSPRTFSYTERSDFNVAEIFHLVLHAPPDGLFFSYLPA